MFSEQNCMMSDLFGWFLLALRFSATNSGIKMNKNVLPMSFPWASYDPALPIEMQLSEKLKNVVNFLLHF